MSADEAARDERSLSAGELDRAEETRVRIRLAQFYRRQSKDFPDRRVDYITQVSWLVRNAPSIDLQSPYWSLPRESAPDDLSRELVQVWEAHVQRQPDDPQIWWNASAWCVPVDIDAAIGFARRGSELEPSARWTQRMSFLEDFARTLSDGAAT